MKGLMFTVTAAALFLQIEDALAAEIMASPLGPADLLQYAGVEVSDIDSLNLAAGASNGEAYDTIRFAAGLGVGLLAVVLVWTWITAS